jgi:hypothetical protein
MTTDNPLRRGHGSTYAPTHATTVIHPSPTTWRARCGRCSTMLGRFKRHPMFGMVCREGCGK